MHDQIYVKNYRKSIEVGAFQEERQSTQELSFSATVHLSPQSVSNDNVDDILSYDVIIEAIDGVLSEKRFNLLETMAEEIASRILAENQALSVRLNIEKLGRIDGALGIQITRSGDGHKPDKNRAPILMQWNNQPIPTIDESVIITLRPNRQPEANEFDQRRFALEEDARTWTLSESLRLPVVDSKVEALALILRGDNFIRAYGKQPFDLLPKLTDFTEKGILNWHLSQLGATLYEAQ